MLTHFTEHEEVIPTYPLIVVDEYQDFSLLETRFLMLLATKSKALIAGDDDQALYTFKKASSRYIRELHADEEYENFDLPYCSRCPEAIVDAVNDVIGAASVNGNLEGRIDKLFKCYVPDKQPISEAHPKIIYAQCTVQAKTAPYPGRYVAEHIAAIPPEDIRASKDGGYPTVLVIGDRPFGPAVYEVVKERFPQAEMRKAPTSLMGPLDGYRRLAADARRDWAGGSSRSASSSTDATTSFARRSRPVTISLRGSRRTTATSIWRSPSSCAGCAAGEALTPEDEKQLAGAVGMEMAEIKESLAVVEKDEDPLPEDEQAEEPSEDAPTIRFTSLIASKGLSAAYVFIVGFNNGFLPRNPKAITDDDVCKLLVALSRTRVECHLVSCRHFGTDWLDESVFADWIRPHLEPVAINKDYFA